jgi:phosphatidyl-myo-inositol dimannoside synthase
VGDQRPAAAHRGHPAVRRQPAATRPPGPPSCSGRAGPTTRPPPRRGAALPHRPAAPGAVLPGRRSASGPSTSRATTAPRWSCSVRRGRSGSWPAGCVATSVSPSSPDPRPRGRAGLRPGGHLIRRATRDLAAVTTISRLHEPPARGPRRARRVRRAPRGRRRPLPPRSTAPRSGPSWGVPDDAPWSAASPGSCHARDRTCCSRSGPRSSASPGCLAPARRRGAAPRRLARARARSGRGRRSCWRAGRLGASSRRPTPPRRVRDAVPDPLGRHGRRGARHRLPRGAGQRGPDRRSPPGAHRRRCSTPGRDGRRRPGPGRLLAALDGWLGDPDGAPDRGHRGPRLAVAQVGWDAIAADLSALLDEVVADAAAPVTGRGSGTRP